jgi:phosphoribosylanthranilate isomerase
MKVKICGLTRREDAICAAEAGADMLGFVFAPSPRRVTPEQVQLITEDLPGQVLKVGVFVNEDITTVRAIIEECGLDYVQLHGDEIPEYCAELGPRAVKAVRVRCAADIDQLRDYACSVYLLDAFDPIARGGTGTQFDHSLAREAKQYGNIIIAGGLTPDNVADAVRAVRPWGCDVSSGVEKEKGVKDHALICQFIRSAKEET